MIATRPLLALAVVATITVPATPAAATLDEPPALTAAALGSNSDSPELGGRTDEPAPSPSPTATPTGSPSDEPTDGPSDEPTDEPTDDPDEHDHDPYDPQEPDDEDRHEAAPEDYEVTIAADAITPVDMTPATPEDDLRPGESAPH